jgi:hypothetical protein
VAGEGAVLTAVGVSPARCPNGSISAPGRWWLIGLGGRSPREAANPTARIWYTKKASGTQTPEFAKGRTA